LLISQKGFDPDAEVRGAVPLDTNSSDNPQDDSGWTPLMIAASVKDADKVADILLARGADVNQTSMPLPHSTTQSLSH
jgi:26S proteasome non-ATPase regulatory subunit 10